VATGTVAAGIVQRTTSVNQAREEHGPGSLTHLMVKGWRGLNEITSLDVLSVDAAGGAVARALTFTFTGTIATPGQLYIYLGGKRLQVLCETDLATCAANLADAINADTDLPFTAAAVAAVTTLTCKWAGLLGNTIDVRLNHLVGEKLPGGLIVTGNGLAVSGSGDIDLSAVVGALDGVHYDVIVHPATDPTNLATIKAELEARDNALVGQQAHAFVGTGGPFATLAAFGDGRNSRFETFLGSESFPGIPAVRGAAVAGEATLLLESNPARPVTGRHTIPGYAPSATARFTQEERNLLLHDGISTYRYTRGDEVQIERLITTHQETSGGSPDDSFLDVQTQFTIARLRRDYVARMARNFGSSTLAENGTAAAPGASVVTPDDIKADAVAWYQGQIGAGIVQDLAGFKAASRVNISASDPTRAEIYLAVKVVQPFRVGAALLQLRA
jgi:phage tail sheath gpL-like